MKITTLERKAWHVWRSAFCGIVSAMAVLAASPAMAKFDKKFDTGRRTAEVVFWRFTQCVWYRDPQTSTELLRSVYWGEKEIYTAGELANRNNSCTLWGGDKLTMRTSLFRSTLASVAFVARHDKQPLPDYTAVPQRFGTAAIAAASTPEQRSRAVLLSFAECVFRYRAEDVRRLLALEPKTEAEKAAWGPLDEVLGGCLPVAPGAQVRFTRVALRGLLGEAAYELDEVLAALPPASQSTALRPAG